MKLTWFHRIKMLIICNVFFNASRHHGAILIWGAVFCIALVEYGIAEFFVALRRFEIERRKA